MLFQESSVEQTKLTLDSKMKIFRLLKRRGGEIRHAEIQHVATLCSICDNDPQLLAAKLTGWSIDNESIEVLCRGFRLNTYIRELE